MKETLVHYILENNTSYPNKEAWLFTKEHQKTSWSWSDLCQNLSNCISGLKTIGVKKGDHVAISAINSPEWALMDFSLMALGAVSIPIYTSTHQKDLDLIFSSCQPQFALVDTVRRAKTLLETRHGKKFKKIIIHDSNIKNQKINLENVQENLLENFPETLLRFRDLLKQPPLLPLKDLIAKVKTTDIATIIYTSGTSGTPKGVPITHRQIIEAIEQVFTQLNISAEDRSLTVLPFSHILGRIELWGNPYHRYTLGFASSMDSLKSDFQKIQPTVFVGVPRIFEKIYYGTQSQIQISPIKRFLFTKAIEANRKLKQSIANKKDPKWSNIIQFQLADKILFKEFHEKMGGQLRFFISGGAPLNPFLSEFFSSWGIPIYEGYGLTETVGPIFMNTPKNNRNGSVGKILSKIDFRIAKDGEILIKGSKIFTGYYGKDLKTLFDKKGYFKTGDIGHIDEDGYLFITDRKKELVKTSGGKFVSPQKIRKLFSPYKLISQVYVHGDKEKYIVVLITLNSKESQNYKGSLKKEVTNIIAKVNRDLARFEKIKKFKILEKQFSVETGELTPSLKMKRKIISNAHKDAIENLYRPQVHNK